MLEIKPTLVVVNLLYLLHKSNHSQTILYMDNWQERIKIDPQVCHGKPCIKGTRIMLSVILDNLAEGLTPEEIVSEYTPLTIKDVRAAISYAAALAKEEELLPIL